MYVQQKLKSNSFEDSFLTFNNAFSLWLTYFSKRFINFKS